jgi:hypothetical protein
MSEFSADWLSLREPADRAARSIALTQQAVAHLGNGRPLCVLDLATGTGSNIRFLAPFLPSPQSWRVIDRDRGLLAQVPQRVGAWAIDRGVIVTGGGGMFTLRGPAMECRVDARSADLSRLGDEQVFDGIGLVTASALLDLVSERWLRALAERCQRAGAVVLFALTYDGRLTLHPEDSDDEAIRTLVNRHQQTTKGFGRALGPDATACAVRCFEAAGYVTRTETSDWRIGPTQRDLQRELITGWAAAALEMDETRAGVIDAWKARRLAHLDSGTSDLVVGHLDFVGWRPEG